MDTYINSDMCNLIIRCVIADMQQMFDVIRLRDALTVWSSNTV